MTRLMTLNIRQGGSKRMPLILDRIRHHDPDVLVLTEFKGHERGLKLQADLAEAGWTHQAASATGGKHNGVLIAARLPFTPVAPTLAVPDSPQRLIGATFADFGITGVYMPQNRAKAPFWQHFVDDAVARQGQRHLFTGDFNTGLHGIDEAGKTFIGADYITRLGELGWHDAWRDRHPDVREGTWVSGKGNWFRVDHAFLSPALRPSLQDAWLSHEEREGTDPATDHSAYLLTLRSDGAA